MATNKYQREQIDVQEFTTSGTWNKPAWADAAAEVEVWLVPAGSGGGSGRRGAAGSNRYGGGGGPSGNPVHAVLPANALPASVSVTVPAGGIGGAAVTTNDTNGNVGAIGGDAQFGSFLLANGPAQAGFGGSAAGGPGGAADTTNVGRDFVAGVDLIGQDGGTGTTASPNTYTPTAGQYGPGGGAAGGGISTANVSSDGQTARHLSVVAPSSIAGGTAPGGVGANGTDRGINPGFGLGGGGGASHASGVGGDGGGGGFPGGGGGGGGASLNGNNSGAGGPGGDGYALVITRRRMA